MTLGARLRQITPFVLFALAALAWFEEWLPGYATIREHFGSNAVLRFVIGLLCVYMILQWLEHRRLELMFGQLLDRLRNLRTGVAPAGDSAGDTGGTPADEEKTRADAMRILASAMAGGDAAVQRSARENLVRLAGEDLGADPAAWSAWIAAKFGKN